jgi:Uma2 family endonuclease
MDEPGWYNRLVTVKLPHASRAEPSGKWTREDLLALPDDGKRHEIIDGEHYATPSPFTKHQVVLGNLYWLVRSHLELHRNGRVYFAPLDVVFSRHDVVEPDLLFVSDERREVVTQENLHGAPDLAVEILSESSRRYDEITKRQLYDRYGVREYWIVDPELETVKVYRRTDGAFARAAELPSQTGDELTTPLIPGLRISLRALFAD